MTTHSQATVSFSPAVTTTFNAQSNTYSLFNWLTNQPVTIDDTQHPIFLALSQHQTTLNYADFASNETFLDDFNWLKNEGFFASQDEMISQTKTIVDNFKALQSKRLDLILLPADEACNFNCVYCYEDHESRKRMGTVHQEAILKWIDHVQPEFMNIEYFGGEPLLNSAFILSLNSAIKTQFPNIQLQSSITTNGALLTESLLEQLVINNVHSFQITLDGLLEDHNVLRVSKRNTGTFDSVYSALELIARRKDLNIYTILRTNFNHKTATPEKRQKFIALIKNLVKDDLRFFVAPKLIGDFSATNQIENLQGKQYVCSKQDANILLEAYETELFNAGLSVLSGQSFPNIGGLQCYAGSPTNFILMPDFQLKKCTVALNEEINHVGTLDSETGIPSLNHHFKQWVTPVNECYSSCYLGKSCQSSACPLKSIKQQNSACVPQKFEPTKITQKVIRLMEVRAE